MSPLRSLLVLLLLSPAAVAQDGDGATVYQKVVRSTVWVHSKHERGMATGSGSLIDKDHRLVLTNYHVVGDTPRATVFFPVLRDGQPVPERPFYRDRANQLAVPGRVVAIDKRADLAVIQIERAPADAPGLLLSPTAAGPGMTVHSIGNAGASGGLWGYVRGTVRQVYQKKWQAKADRILSFEAKVVETDSPTNPGDSGGPLVNDKGELVGVTQGGAVGANLVSFFVDLSEVKRFLATEDVVAVRGRPKPAPKEPTPKRETALAVNDTAGLFPADAVTAAQTQVNELFARQKLDVLIETFPGVPAADAAQVQAMPPDEQTAYLRDWARSRARREGVSGLVVLVVQEPRKLYIDVTGDRRDTIPTDAVPKLVQATAAGLQKSPRDLSDLLNRIREYAGAK